jgi:hypothetical protein
MKKKILRHRAILISWQQTEPGEAKCIVKSILGYHMVSSNNSFTYAI